MFVYNGKNENLLQAAKVANLNISEILTEVLSVDFFLGDTASQKIDTKQVYLVLSEVFETAKIEVCEYSYFNRNVLGYYSKATPNKIFVNTRALPRSIESIVGNFFHEACHYAGFSHGSNRYRPWKAMTVPYRVGDLAQQVINGIGASEVESEYHSKIIPRPLWHKILFFWR